MALRITKTAIEVLALTNPNLRITKTAIEVLTGAAGGGSGIVVDPIYSLPAITPTSSEWTFASNARVSVSPISQYVQTARRGPERWIVRLSFLKRSGVQRGQLQAFLAQLNGRRYTFTMRDHSYTRRGSGAGTPLVKGAGQVGDELLTDGWTASAAGVLLAGDLVQVRNQLVMVTEDSNADVGGNATLKVRPSIRYAPDDNSTIQTATPLGRFRLASPEATWSQGPGPIFSDFIFVCEEDVAA